MAPFAKSTDAPAIDNPPNAAAAPAIVDFKPFNPVSVAFVLDCSALIPVFNLSNSLRSWAVSACNLNNILLTSVAMLISFFRFVHSVHLES